MNLQEKIKGDLKVAMKESNKEAKDIIRVVIGEFNRVGKEVSDQEATAIIKKMVANANEMNNTAEADFLSEYLPKQLSEHDLRNIIQGILSSEHNISSMRDIGRIMGILQKEYAGMYDGKLASTIIKDKLK
jgi:hypothetical protein